MNSCVAMDFITINLSYVGFVMCVCEREFMIYIFYIVIILACLGFSFHITFLF